MTDTFLCDYCRAAINPGLDTSLLVGVYRRVDEDEWGDDSSTLVSGNEVTFRYCSQQHAAQHLERIPLPPISASDDAGALAAFVAVVVGLGLVALTVYGGVQFWQEVASTWF